MRVTPHSLTDLRPRLKSLCDAGVMAPIRPARPADVGALVRIAAAGGSPDGDERYFGFVASHGRLLVADDDAAGVVGFGGAVDVDDVAMVTDLFVDPDHRGHGIGTAILGHVLGDSTRRMTCSSLDPAAQAAYVAAGMAPKWRLLTMRGRATGGGPPLVASPWQHDRRDLVDYFGSLGAVVDGGCVVSSDEAGDRPLHTVLRLVADDPSPVVDALLRALPEGHDVVLSVPEPHPIVPVLEAHRFTVEEHDVFFATDGVHLVPQLTSVHRGLL